MLRTIGIRPETGFGVNIKSIGAGVVSPWTIVSSGLCWYRKGERGGMYVIDKSTDGGVTWELDLVVLELDEDSIIMTIDDGEAGYRQQVRACVLYIDQVLTPIGFAGIENTDWEWIWSEVISHIAKICSIRS